MASLKVGIVGAGKRVLQLYGPILRMQDHHYDLVGITSRSYDRAETTARLLGTTPYLSIDHLADKANPDILIVSVNYHANDEAGLTALSTGKHCLLETPVAVHPETFVKMQELTKRLGNHVEVAEQYYRRPMERIKQVLLQEGLFGKVQAAYNDFLGHDYHGFSIIRSYIGFDVPAVRIQGWQRTLDTAPYFSSISKQSVHHPEDWQHGVVEFANGSMGFFHFTGQSYDSPLRWQRSTRFFAERGMAVNHELTLVTKDGRDPFPIRLERRIHNVGGVEALASVVAHVEHQKLEWVNPFRGEFMDDEMIATADCLESLRKAIDSNRAPEYGIENAWLDQHLTLCMRESAKSGVAVEVPSP